MTIPIFLEKTMLPVEQHINEILQVIEDNRVCSVQASTGSGKSTLIAPLFVLSKNRTAKVLIIQPTVIACNRTCEQVQRLFPRLRLGIGAGGISNYNEETEIIFATGGHIELKFGKLQSFDGIDLVIFDEVHTTSIEYEVLTIMVQHLFEKLTCKFLLLTATMLNTITESWSKLLKHPLTCFELQVKMFTIEETFSLRDYSIGVKDDEEDLILNTIQYLAQENKSAPMGHFLVFCSGREMIDKIYNRIYDQEFNLKFDNCNIYCAYSSMPNEEIDEAFSQVKPVDNMRSIILATDIAETSVTIPYLALVLDMGHQKHLQCYEDEVSMLTTIRVSKFAAIQRRGRTGRTNPGKCHRMYTKACYDSLQPCYQAALQRTPLHQTILKLISFQLDPYDLLENIVENPNMIHNCLKRLKEQDLIFKNSQNYELSQEAETICYLPLRLSFARCLYLLLNWDFKAKYLGFLTLCIAEVETTMTMVYLPRKNRDESKFDHDVRIMKHREKYERFEEHSTCPLNTSVNAYLSYLEETSKMNHRQKIKWTLENGLNNKTINAISSLFKRVTKRFDVSIVHGLYDVNRMIASFFQDCLIDIFKQRFTSYFDDKSDKWYEDNKDLEVKPFYRINNRGFSYDLQYGTTRLLCLHQSLSRQNVQFVSKIISIFVFV